MTKIWVTKYALSAGIWETDAAEIGDHLAVVKVENGTYLSTHYFHRDEWKPTLLLAVEQAEKMRGARIASLKKSLAKVEKLQIKVADKL